MVEVTVKLRDRQRSKEYGKWLCTINGESRIVPNHTVRWYCESIDHALNSFDKNEIFSLKIEEKAFI